MELEKIIITSFKSILFAAAVIALALPVLLSMPGVSEFLVSALSFIGLGGAEK